MHNPDSQLLISDVKNGEVVKEIVEPSNIDRQTRLIWLLFINLISWNIIGCFCNKVLNNFFIYN